MKRVSKVIAMLLAVMMFTVLFTSCKGANSKNSTDSTSVANTSANQPVTTQEVKKEVVTLKLYGVSENASQKQPGVQTDPVAKYMEEKLGLKIEFYPSESAEILSTMMASNDMPDLLLVHKASMQQLIDGKLITPLDDLIKTNGPDIQKLPGSILKYDKDYLGGGKTYCLTLLSDPSPSELTISPWVRWDYYKELGYPAVNNDDDLLNVVSQMIKKHPTNEDGQKYFGFSPWFDWAMWSYTTWAAGREGMWFFGMLDYDMNNNYAASHVALNENGSFWYTVKFLNKAKRMGLLDPDALTQKYDTAIEKAKSNRVLCSLVSWPAQGANPGLAQLDPSGEKGYAPIPPPEGTNAWFGGYKQPLGADGHYVISANSKYPDRSMDFINFAFSQEGARVFQSGLEGQTYDVVDGKPVLRQEAIDEKANMTEIDRAVKTGILRYNSGLSPYTVLPDGKYVNLFEDPDEKYKALSTFDMNYLSYFNVKTRGELLEKRAKNVYVNTALIALTPAQPDDIKRIDSNIQTYMMTEASKLILSNTEDAFNAGLKKVIEEIKKKDYDKSNEYWTKVAEDAHKMVEEFK